MVNAEIKKRMRITFMELEHTFVGFIAYLKRNMGKFPTNLAECAETWIRSGIEYTMFYRTTEDTLYIKVHVEYEFTVEKAYQLAVINY